MNRDQYVHEDLKGKIPVNNTPVNDDVRSLLQRRTVLTALVSISITFILTVTLSIFAVAIAFPEGFEDTGENAIYFDDADSTGVALDKLNSVIALIKDNYYIDLTDAQIIEAIAASLPSGLGSPYTYYLTAEEYAEIEESMSGEYVGIGCTVSRTAQGETEIVEVYPDSPAEEAGLQTGDLIISVNGEDVYYSVDITTVAAKVKGEAGTSVKIGFYRPSSGETFEMDIIRRVIEIENVSYRMLTEDIGYLHVNGFVEGVDIDFIAAMDDLQAQGAKDIVFDMRFNSGGSAAVMMEMLDYLLPKDTLLSTIKGREFGEEYTIEWKTQKDASVPDDMNYAILVNSYSASAAEFFSGCLHDHDKAVLIGETTFGKGSGTITYDLDDGSAVNLTVFQYFLPDGDNIEGIGLEPDIEAVIADEYKYTAVESLTLEQDTVLQRAISELQAD